MSKRSKNSRKFKQRIKKRVHSYLYDTEISEEKAQEISNRIADDVELIFLDKNIRIADLQNKLRILKKERLQ